MEIGFLTACMKDDFESTLQWAKENGFNNLEIGGRHMQMFRMGNIEKIKQLRKKYEMNFTAIGKFANWLDMKPAVRIIAMKPLYRLVDVAAELKIPCVTTFVGLNNKLDYRGNLRLFKKVWVPLAKYAEEKNINIGIENCPMKKDYAFFGGNLMISPGIWNDLFQMTPANFGLNFDPSHLVWQMIDPALAVEEFPERIHHVHAKDCKINTLLRDVAGVFGKGTYSYPLPGRGDIDWMTLLGSLKEVGYSGVLSIEQEDGAYHGTPEKVKEGLLLGQKNLKAFLGRL